MRDDATKLIETLQAERPDLWARYLKEELKDNALSPETRHWILLTQRRLFPDRALSIHTDVLFLMRRRIGIELGQIKNEEEIP